jgi:septal ring factor EnvC (AmiA/AmiB activator)
MRVTQPFGFAQGREHVERQMGVFRQPQLKASMDFTRPTGHKARFSYIGVLALFQASVWLGVATPPSIAKTKPGSETRKDQIKQIERELSREQQQYVKFGEKEENLLGQLTALEQQITKKQRLLKEIRQRIGISRIELESRREEVSRLEQSLAGVRDRLSKRLVAFYKYAKRAYVQLLAGSNDLDQLRKRGKYLKAIVAEDRRLIEEIVHMQLNYQEEIVLVKEKLAVIDDMEETEKSRLASIKQDLDQKVLLLMKIHREKEFYETAVKELRLAAEELRQTLLTLSRKQSNRKTRRSNFSRLRGKLPHPLEGEVTKNRGPLDGGSQEKRKGIYIEAPAGTEVKAVAEGRVDFSGWLKGYGQIIVINHGSRFFTVSAHLAERAKEQGDLVAKGESIGLLGETGSLTGPNLYFEIRKGDTNLDPLEWLKRN